MVRFSKDTVFEGYYTACREYSAIEKEPDYMGRSWAKKHMRKWFLEYLEHTLKDAADQERYSISLDDLIPKQVFKRLLTSPNQKFRFRFAVEAEEI